MKSKKLIDVYKNLPIGKKIGGGFLVIMIIMAILMAFTTVTSVQRIGNLNSISYLSQFQGNLEKLLEEVYKAQMASKIVFESLDTQEAYNDCLTSIEASLACVNDLKELSKELGGYQAEAIEQIGRDLSLWRQSIDSVQAGNQNMSDSRDVLIRSSRDMAVASTELWENIGRLTIELSGQGLAATVQRIETVILPSTRLSEFIDSTRITGASLILDFDKSVVDTLYKNIEEIGRMNQELANQVTTDEAKASTTNMGLSLAEYKTSLDDFIFDFDAINTQTAQADKTMETVLQNVDNMNDIVNAEVGTFIQGNISTAYITIVVMLVLTLVAFVISFFVSSFLRVSITRPLSRMKEILLMVGEYGDMNFPEEMKKNLDEEALIKDEIGQSIHAFRSMIRRLEYISENLKQIADGDLTIQIKLLSEVDVMGSSMKRMTETLLRVMSEINEASAQVAAGASEVADAATALAQGSTEQAATVQEINATITEISDQAKYSVKTAGEIAHESGEIRDIAIEGNEKMNHMMQAMQAISEASQSIEQVIKNIDDIAFQTNILALNAAVEAARAGEQGKGFAVVADEVRKLAEMSKEAAEGTAVLISANIEKARAGMDIVQDTASALESIGFKIDHNYTAVQRMSELATHTSIATEEVNKAVDQVTQVIQQNSATSEESAAASEEMSSQASLLQHLVARFKVR